MNNIKINQTNAKSCLFVAAFVTLGILISAQIAFLAAPQENILRLAFFRPLFYAAALVIYLALSGFPRSPKRTKATKANLVACCGLVFYLALVLIMGIIYGFGINAAAPGFKFVLENLWTYGTIVIMSEIIRLGIIKSAPSVHHGKVMFLVVVVFSFLQLDAIRELMYSDGVSYTEFTDFFFSSLFPIVVLNAALCYMAVEGSLLSLIIIRSAYSLLPITLLYVPNVPAVSWSFFTTGVLVVTVIFYYIFMDDRSKEIRRRDKIRAEFQQKSRSFQVITASVLLVLAAFILRAFVYFPVVVLTGSMTGTIDEGSLVFVKKISPEDVAATVIEGDIILFQNGNSETMHRVIDIEYHTDGEPYYQTKGDANPAADPFTVEQAQVVGVTKTFIPYIGYPIVVINSVFR